MLCLTIILVHATECVRLVQPTQVVQVAVMEAMYGVDKFSPVCMVQCTTKLDTT